MPSTASRICACRDPVSASVPRQRSSLSLGHALQQLHPFMCNRRDNLSCFLQIIIKSALDIKSQWISQLHWPPAVHIIANMQIFCHFCSALSQNRRAPKNMPPLLAYNEHVTRAVPPGRHLTNSLSFLSSTISSTYLCAPTDCTSVISTVFTKETDFGPP